MLHDPDVLILDEPTSGLDPNQLTDIRQVIKSLGREKTVILSTHIMQEVQAICDRIIIINRGKLVANDTTETLTLQLQGQSMVELELAKPMDTKLLAQIKGADRVDEVSPGHYRIFTAPGKDIREALFRLAVQHE
jgi:ABC-2 type transport system ATP-binding protein